MPHLHITNLAMAPRGRDIGTQTNHAHKKKKEKIQLNVKQPVSLLLRDDWST